MVAQVATATKIANQAAGIAVSKPGTATVSASELKTEQNHSHNILNQQSLPQWLQQQRLLKHTIAFTNGCFDLLHVGHIYCLQQAAKLADKLIVGVNCDASVKRLKGEARPINNLSARMQVLAALDCVSAVIDFGEVAAEQDTPLHLINHIQPDVLVKGGDYRIKDIVGAQEVLANGGKVHCVDYQPGYSTTELIHKINA